jgi:hypothetical protein
MDETLHATLSRWGDFYLITGGAAAALTGLQFVVQTLIASEAFRPVTGDDAELGIAAFGTPTVVHFSVALMVSAIMCVPWPDYATLRYILGVVAIGALVYAVVVFRRARRQRSYAPAAEDWIWHVLLPVVAYGAILLSASLMVRYEATALFGVGAAALLLLCTGIHNAWDTVTYLTIAMLRVDRSDAQPAASPAPAVEPAAPPLAEAGSDQRAAS